MAESVGLAGSTTPGRDLKRVATEIGRLASIPRRRRRRGRSRLCAGVLTAGFACTIRVLVVVVVMSGSRCSLCSVSASRISSRRTSEREHEHAKRNQPDMDSLPVYWKAAAPPPGSSAIVKRDIQNGQVPSSWPGRQSGRAITVRSIAPLWAMAWHSQRSRIATPRP